MKMFLFLMISVLAGTAFAAPRVNNGGGGWACRNKQSGEVLWVKAADLTKVEFYSPGKLTEKDGHVWALLAEQHNLIERALPRLAQILKSYPLNISQRLRSVPEALSYIPDAELRYKPPTTSCPGGVVSFVQLADANLDGEIIYSKRVWDLPVFSNYQKAAILLHEEIYYALRKVFGDGSSYRTRQIIGLMYSGLSDFELNRQVEEVLNDKARVQQGIFGFANGPALFNVQVTCTLNINDGEYTYSWTPDLEVPEFYMVIHGFKFFVDINPVDGSPKRLQIKEMSSKFSAISEITETVPTFNSLKRVQLLLRGESSKARLACESNSVLDNDPL
ncbi:hypothetical protein ACLVWU_09375 [Bdellovibrio sp. HCB290]|uniref:hypothetical protein n=1 Tax=Bdellovibrio sp. HCB290 TaxID=3394356 RepID=UPI0039B44F7D